MLLTLILIAILVYTCIGLVIDIIFVLTLKLLSNKFNIVNSIEQAFYDYLVFDIDIFVIIFSMPIIWPIWMLFFLILIICYIIESLTNFINSEKLHNYKKEFFNMKEETDEYD